MEPIVPNRQGQIQLILGPMFSGKTTELMRRIRRYKIAQYSCLIIKYAADTRYSAENASTHDKTQLEAFPCSRLSEAAKVISKSHVIGIDEGQFFPDLIEVAEELANLGKIVVISALDGTFQRKAFGRVLELVPLAESVVKLTAVCTRCFRDASFSLRLGNETAVEVIGGSDMYVAVCRECFIDETSKKSNEPPKSKYNLARVINNDFQNIINPQVSVGFSSGRAL